MQPLTSCVNSTVYSLPVVWEAPRALPATFKPPSVTAARSPVPGPAGPAGPDGPCAPWEPRSELRALVEMSRRPTLRSRISEEPTDLLRILEAVTLLERI